jgi:hypothetical protein
LRPRGQAKRFALAGVQIHLSTGVDANDHFALAAGDATQNTFISLHGHHDFPLFRQSNEKHGE